jgi:hypothetical protein
VTVSTTGGQDPRVVPSTARTATIRTRIVNVAARLAHRARTIHLHLPQHWPWQAAFENLFTAVHPAPG